ncbi:MAG: GlsB/YeaQ/YmgE family stress response membrane protein [Candidatus Saccharimonadales bacterium]
MGILAWIVLGGIAGWIASMIAGNNASQGLIGNIFIGIVGAFIGGFLVSLLGGEGITGFNLWSLLVAVAGATLLLLIFRRGKHAA